MAELERKNTSETTKLAELEHSLAEAHTRIKELEEYRTSLISMVCHDIRAPLGVILGALSELDDPKTENAEQQKVYFALMKRSAEKLGRLASNLLDLSKLDAKRMEYHFRPTDLKKLSLEAIQIVTHLEGRPPLHVETRIPHENIEAEIDGERILQALTNILSNAFRFARARVEVSIEIEPEQFRISVTDDGPGIPSEALPNIFQRFRSAAGGKKSKTGLGLAIVRGIVDGHFGNVFAENVAPHGARFTMVIPKVARKS